MFSLIFPLLICSSAQAATRYFAIDVSWDQRSPDGFSRAQIVVNGTSPGPTLIVDEGDDVEFLVRNHLSEKTSVHFHGITQLNTPWSDGVGGLSQRPIPPGGEYLYKWTATDYGTYWYHAHYKSQVSDGMYGAMHIRPRECQERPFSRISSDPMDIDAMMRAEKDPNMVMISDWTHVQSSAITEYAKETNLDIPCTNSILVNGKGSVNCMTSEEQEAAVDPAFHAIFTDLKTGEWLGTQSGCSVYSPLLQGNYSVNYNGLPSALTECSATKSPQEVIEVHAGERWTSLNFISALSIQAPVISLDGHRMWIYAIDGRYIEPVLVDGFQMYNGNRYSAMIRLNQRPGQYTLRANNYGANQIISGFATLRYGKFHRKRRPEPSFTLGGTPTSPEVVVLNETTIIPFENIPPSMEVNQTHIMHITRYGAPWIFKLDGIPYPQISTEYAEDTPLLYYPNSEEAHNESLIIQTLNGTWVDLVFVVSELINPPHPMHKHSNKFYVLGSGYDWNWTTVAEAAAAQPGSFNFESPQFRDVFATPPTVDKPSWLAIRYQVINPGAFLLHCHIQPHLTGGIALAFMDGIDAFPEIPEEYQLD